MTIDIVSDRSNIKSKGVLLRYDFSPIVCTSLKILRILSSFPLRFILCGFFFAYVLLDTPYLEIFQDQIMIGMFQFFHVQAYLDEGKLFIGSVYSPIQFPVLVKAEVLYLMFFISFAVATRSNLQSRARLLLNAFLCLIVLIVVEFLIAITMVAINNTSVAVYSETNVIFMNLAASAFMEKSLFSSMKLPRPNKITPFIKTNNIMHYVYYAATMLGAALVGFSFLQYFQLSNNNLFVAYMAVSVGQIMALKSYLANFIYELKSPKWAKVIRSKSGTTLKNMSISFLLPAFNEENFIRQCIEGLDKVASKYSGWTEIIVVNDGSTDNTRKIASAAILNLKHANGKVYNIPNSGLVRALQYGLQRTKGEIVFRTDSDSITHEDALSYLIPHFYDPRVATLSGAILSLKEKVWWQKIQTLSYCGRIFNKRNDELFDSILTQGGTFTVFRREALMKVGGWIHDVMGEDAEMTIRLGRYGYRHEFDPYAVQFGNVPIKWKDVIAQRVKWSMAYYQAYAANTNIIKEFKPMSIQFMMRMSLHGMGLARALFIPFVIVYFLIELSNPSSSLSSTNLISFSGGLVAFLGLLEGLEAVTTFYFLRKFKKLYLMKYYLHSRFFPFLVGIYANLLATEIHLYVSSKFKGTEHSSELNQALKKRAKEEISSVFR